MLVNEDSLDPPVSVIEDSESEIASKLADNFIPTQLILQINIPSATIRSQHDTVNLAKFRKPHRNYDIPKQKSFESLASGIFQQLQPVPLSDIGKSSHTQKRLQTLSFYPDFALLRLSVLLWHSGSGWLPQRHTFQLCFKFNLKLVNFVTVIDTPAESNSTSESES
jgi:hypothetical protein